jgi:hypothetical protein
MKTLLLHLLPVSLLGVAGAGAQESGGTVSPPADQLIILTADKKPSAKTSPQPPKQLRVTPQQLELERQLLQQQRQLQRRLEAEQRLRSQPRSTMPVIQHDISQYPMPVTAGKGQPVRIPVAPPKPPFDER